MLRFAQRLRPIFGAELAFQMRAGQTRRRWRSWAGRLVWLAALGVCLTAYLGELIGALLWRDTSRIHDTITGPMVLALIVAAVMFFLLLLEGLARGANTITRERASGNWDMLVLTGVDARRIVRGKWWATVRASWPGWLRLLPLRAGLSVFVGAELSRLSSLYIANFAPDQMLIPPNPIGILLVPVALLVFSFAAAALAAAVGVLASAVARRPVAALPIALALYVGLAAAGIGGAALVQRGVYEAFRFGSPEQYARYAVATNALATLQFTWIDNGTLLAATLVDYELVPANSVTVLSPPMRPPSDEPRRLQLLSYAAALPVIFGGYVVSIWAALRLAERFAVRAGAEPHPPAPFAVSLRPPT